MLKKIQKHHIFLVLLILFAAILLPSTSPLRLGNIDIMIHDYFNFAKSMLQGDLLYVDLYDHKGLLLFALYIIPVLISNTSFVGVFVFEALISIGIVLSCYKLLRGYKYSVTSSLIYTFVSVIVLRFVFKQAMLNTEPLCIVIILLLLQWIETEKYRDFCKKDYLLFGLIFGALLWMKYPMVIVLFPFWLYVFIYSIKTKNVGLLLKRCLLSVLGVVIVSIPVFGYIIHNHIVENMVNVYFLSIAKQKWVLIGSLLEISIGLLFILALIGIIMTYKKDKNKLFFTIMFVVIFFFSNIGGISCYTASPLIVLVPMWLPVVWKGKYTRPIATGIIALMVLLFLSNTFNTDRLYVKEIAEKHQITNDNILYLSEDMGFGSYSPEGFRKPGQWMPGRTTYNDNNDMYKQTMTYISEKEFEYLCVRADDYDCVISNEEYDKNKYARIVKNTQENYEIVDYFVHNESMAKFYLLQARK